MMNKQWKISVPHIEKILGTNSMVYQEGTFCKVGRGGGMQAFLKYLATTLKS
jgi:hypothetical protein